MREREKERERATNIFTCTPHAENCLNDKYYETEVNCNKLFTTNSN